MIFWFYDDDYNKIKQRFIHNHIMKIMGIRDLVYVALYKGVDYWSLNPGWIQKSRSGDLHEVGDPVLATYAHSVLMHNFLKWPRNPTDMLAPGSKIEQLANDRVMKTNNACLSSTQQKPHVSQSFVVCVIFIPDYLLVTSRLLPCTALCAYMIVGSWLVPICHMAAW